MGVLSNKTWDFGENSPQWDGTKLVPLDGGRPVVRKENMSNIKKKDDRIRQLGHSICIKQSSRKKSRTDGGRGGQSMVDPSL